MGNELYSNNQDKNNLESLSETNKVKEKNFIWIDANINSINNIYI